MLNYPSEDIFLLQRAVYNHAWYARRADVRVKGLYVVTTPYGKSRVPRRGTRDYEIGKLQISYSPLFLIDFSHGLFFWEFCKEFEIGMHF
jgi:hypothetical protein